LNNNESSPTQSVDIKLFRLMVASVKDYAIFVIDPNGYILSWNVGAQHIKGYSEEEVIGKHISIFYLKDDMEKQQLRNNLNQALKNGVYETEGWRVRKDGTMFWANMVLTTLYNDEGKLIGFAKVTRDITVRKEAEDKKTQINVELEKRVQENTQKIISNEIRFRKLIENSYEGISLFDKDLKVFYRSPSCKRIYGWNLKDRVEEEAFGIVHPDDEPHMQKQLEKLLKTPAGDVVVVCRVKHKNGHYIWVESVFTNMFHDVHIKAIVCNFRDITEQRNAEIERENATADLLKRNNDLEQFAYLVSHNLRLPVANIAGLSNLLREYDTDEAAKPEILNRLEASIKSLDTVVVQLNQILQDNLSK
jgi:PAS domain S-box-containing protein